MSVYVSFKCDKCGTEADFEIEELYDKMLKSIDLMFEFPRDWEIRDDKMLCETCQDYDEANEVSRWLKEEQKVKEEYVYRDE